MARKQYTSDLILNDSNDFININAVASNITVTLNSGSSYSDKAYTVRKVDAGSNTVTLTAQSDELINDAQTFVLNAQNDYVTIMPNDNGFDIIDESATVNESLDELAANKDTATEGYVLTANGDGTSEFKVSVGGGVGMASETYDPNEIEGDVFDMDNMVEGTDTKIPTAAEIAAIATNSAKVTYPSADSTKLALITVDDAVNLGTIVSDIESLTSEVNLLTARVTALEGNTHLPVDYATQIDASDYADLPTAFAALSGGDIELIVPAGTYALTSTLSVSSLDTVGITMDDAAIVTYDAPGYQSVLEFNSCTDLIIKGGVIDGLDGGISMEKELGCIEFNSGINCIVDGTTVQNNAMSGVTMNDCTDCTVRNLISDNVEHPVHAVRGSGMIVELCELDKDTEAYSYGTTGEHGIRGYECSGMIIRNNTVNKYELGIELYKDCDNSLVYGNTVTRTAFTISLDRSDGSKVYDNVLSGADAVVSFNHGIELAQSDNVEVYGNTVTGHSTAGNGVNVWTADMGDGSGSEYANVHDNTLSNLGSAIVVSGSALASGVNGANHTTIYNNTVTNVATAFVELGQYNTQDVEISYNTCDISADKGIFVPSGRLFDEINIHHNDISNCDGNGIHDFESDTTNLNDNIDIENNTVDTCGGKGIFVFGQNRKVWNNTFIDCADKGIDVYGVNISGSLSICYNTIDGCGSTGSIGVLVDNIMTNVTLYLYSNTFQNTPVGVTEQFITGTTGTVDTTQDGS